MKKKLYIGLCVAFVVVVSVAVTYRRPRDLSSDCDSFVRNWADGKEFEDIILTCGMRPLQPESQSRAKSLLVKVSGPFKIVSRQISPRFSTTQGIFFSTEVNGKPSAFGVQGYESENRTLVEFERMLGQACVMNQLATRPLSRITTYEAMVNVLPSMLPELESLKASSVQINGYGYGSWSEALTAVEEKAQREIGQGP